MKALALVALSAATAHAADAPAAAKAKKDRDRAGKSSHHLRALPAVGARPARLVNLWNTHTHEWLAVEPDHPPTGAIVDHFLRDHYTNREMAMDAKLVPTLIAAARHFHSGEVDIVSGFRHPKFNLMLRKKGHQVARDSQHTHGNACDFYLPGVPIRSLHAWAKDQQLGGVGLYLESGFVHIDTGAIRYWSGD